MISAGIKELKNNLSRYLSQAKEGEDIEALAAIHRKKRETKFDNDKLLKILDTFRCDWSSFIRVDVTDDLNEWIDKIVSHYPLRGFGAIHLASALIVHDKISEEFLFACFDKKLRQVAQLAGLKTLPDMAAI